MLDVVHRTAAWLAPGSPPFAVATIVAAGGSVPRPVGTSMAVRSGAVRSGAVHGDEVVGSLSGGCVEAAVHAACVEAVRTGRPHRESFGWSAQDAFAVGLTCGGTIDVLVQPVDPSSPGHLLGALRRLAAAPEDAPALLVRRVAPDDASDDVPPPPPSASSVGRKPGTGRLMTRSAVGAAVGGSAVGGVLDAGTLAALLRPLLDDERSLPGAVAQVGALARAGASGVVRVAPDGAPRPAQCAGPDARPGSAERAPVTLLVETRLAPPRMIVCGANDHGAALTAAARLLGYRVTLVDARPLFADPRRFPAADVVVDWPDRYLAAEVAAGRTDARTAVAVLTHDAKVDVPLLALALRTDLGYVGAMASRRAHAERVAALREEGLTDADLARLRSPIGLDVGAVTPAEIAVSVLAEVVAAARPGATGVPLSGLDGPLHPAPQPKESDRPWT
ncbi:XdhC family protein [Cellulomonas sp. PhB143]|uniref:XdhC family protein n=1 Tax=Cellulomonas sp. PhB143 TaxID=2485186 RepID=UPI000F4AED95|nr:XdhC/CoxI family protein [Cellulomonas sp. PhB143]ROS74467.1 xanthine dehydrogenase accessory factor [Cellulomonas sp. PhB143]